MSATIDKELLRIVRDVLFSIGRNKTDAYLMTEVKKLVQADKYYTDAEIIQALITAREIY